MKKQCVYIMWFTWKKRRINYFRFIMIRCKKCDMIKWRFESWNQMRRMRSMCKNVYLVNRIFTMYPATKLWKEYLKKIEKSYYKV